MGRAKNAGHAGRTDSHDDSEIGCEEHLVREEAQPVAGLPINPVLEYDVVWVWRRLDLLVGEGWRMR
jgi:hypothetical protein